MRWEIKRSDSIFLHYKPGRQPGRGYTAHAKTRISDEGNINRQNSKLSSDWPHGCLCQPTCIFTIRTGIGGSFLLL